GATALDVEEVGAAEVGVAAVVAGADRREVDSRLDTGLQRIRRDLEHAGEVGEAAAHLGDHQGAGHEPAGGVGRVHVPGAGGEYGEVGHRGLLVRGCRGLPTRLRLQLFRETVALSTVAGARVGGILEPCPTTTATGLPGWTTRRCGPGAGWSR